MPRHDMDIEDDNDAAWGHQQQLEERQREDEELDEDPGYVEFLRSYAESFIQRQI